jgi:quercetin dioxygenase-like cupin family protein
MVDGDGGRGLYWEGPDGQGLEYLPPLRQCRGDPCRRTCRRKRGVMTGPLHRPYAPDLYRGTAGEQSAWLRSGDTDAEITYPSGGTCEYLATGDQTAHTFGLYRWTFGPDESGPDPHFHRAITESFYVLSGEVSLYDGAGWRTGRVGDFFFVPHGGLHGFRGGDHASMLLMFTPGAPREDYFETLAGLAEKPLTDEDRVEFMLRHDTYWV